MSLDLSSFGSSQWTHLLLVIMRKERKKEETRGEIQSERKKKKEKETCSCTRVTFFSFSMHEEEVEEENETVLKDRRPPGLSFSFFFSSGSFSLLPVSSLVTDLFQMGSRRWRSYVEGFRASISIDSPAITLLLYLSLYICYPHYEKHKKLHSFLLFFLVAWSGRCSLLSQPKECLSG